MQVRRKMSCPSVTVSPEEHCACQMDTRSCYPLCNREARLPHLRTSPLVSLSMFTTARQVQLAWGGWRCLSVCQANQAPYMRQGSISMFELQKQVVLVIIAITTIRVPSSAASC